MIAIHLLYFGNKIWQTWDVCLITRSSLEDASAALAILSCFSKGPCFCSHAVTWELQLIIIYACLFLKLDFKACNPHSYGEHQPAKPKKKKREEEKKKSKILFTLILLSEEQREQLSPVSKVSTSLLTWVLFSDGVSCGCTGWQYLWSRSHMNGLRWLLARSRNSWHVGFLGCTVQWESTSLSLSLLLAANKVLY